MIQCSQVNLDLVIAAGIDRRPAIATEIPAFILGRIACDGDIVSLENRRGMKDCPVMFPAIQAMANPDAIWFSLCGNPDLSTKTTAFNVIHIKTRNCDGMFATR